MESNKVFFRGSKNYKRQVGVVFFIITVSSLLSIFDKIWACSVSDVQDMLCLACMQYAQYLFLQMHAYDTDKDQDCLRMVMYLYTWYPWM